jgi:hypothetical protein
MKYDAKEEWLSTFLELPHGMPLHAGMKSMAGLRSPIPTLWRSILVPL